MRLKRTVRSETVINKSRFITCARPVHTEEEARAFITEIRKEFPDSTHVCTAYVLSDRDIQRSSDNGEPAGTAGIPILEAIRHAGLTDTCVAVVRYFGGIKLGTGGLARAYGGCTQSLLNESPKVEDKEVTVYSVTYPYSLSGVLEGWIRREYEVVDFFYEDNVTCLFASDDPSVPTQIQNLSKGSVTAEAVRRELRETDV